MAQPVIQPSFANGEFSPQLYSRVDLQKYKSAFALGKNFFVDYRGGVSNRPGSFWVGQAKETAPNRAAPPRLIPFLFSTIQAYALEFGNGYIRVIKNGSYVLEATKTVVNITKANPGNVDATAHGYSNGDWVYFQGVLGMTQMNNRFAIVANATVNNFDLVNPLTGQNIDTTAYGTYTALSGTVARVYTISTPYIGADIKLLKYTQSADVMTLTHPSYAQRELTRTADNSWTLTTIVFAAELTPPGGLTVTPSTVGTVYYAYRVTAVTESGDESVASELDDTLSTDIITTANHITISWNSVAGAKFYNVYKASAVKNAVSPSTNSPPVPTLFGFMITTEALLVADTYIEPDYAKTPPLARNPFAPGQIIAVTLGAGGSGYTSKPTVGVTGGGGSGAVIEALLNGGAVVGFIIVNAGGNYTSAPTLTITGGGGSGATATATIGPLTGTYPGVCGYLQQRRVFAGSTNNPKGLWMSQPGLHYNFNVSNPIRDDDAISGELDSLEVNAIQHLVPMPGGVGSASALIAFTTGGIWQISGGGNSQPITPSNSQAISQANQGANIYLRPVTVNDSILYAPYKGTTVLDLSYNVRTNIYAGQEISTLSSHLFTDYEVVSWAYAYAPHKLVYAIRDDGIMLTLTILKEQEVLGWSWSDTQGRYVSVCVIPETETDAVYYIVERVIAGQYTYYVERAASREIRNNIQNSWFFDSALTTAPSLPNTFIAPNNYTVGTGRTFTLGSAVLNSGHINHQIRSGNGIALITNVVGTAVTVNILADFPHIPNTTMPQNIFSGDWELWAPVTSVSGLWHLEGATVGLFGDGTYIGTATVVDGAVALGGTYFRVLVGLKYQAQFQTLYMDIGNPTIEGKRKQAYGLTTRVSASFGFKVGDTFDTLQTWIVNVQNFNGTTTNGVRTGDYRRNIAGGWTVLGQQCIQMDDPYPVTILGVIPEITIGDSPG